MKTRTTILACIMSMMSVMAFSQACVDFESLILGTEYGDGINAIGDVIFTENDIPVTVEYFEWVGGGGTFGTATVTNGSSGIGSGLDVFISNINFGFDFSNLNFVPNWVTFDFVDQGGEENISVNGSPIYKGDLELAVLPPGVTMVINNMGTYNQAILAGNIQSLLIGGQEFTLDNVCAMVKPDEGPCIEFETLPIGAIFGDGYNSLGEEIFIENDMAVAVDSFFYVGGGGNFSNCNVIDGSATFGTGNAMWTSNINLIVDFTNVPGMDVNKVTFDFADYGGSENFSINGAPIYAGELMMAPTPPNIFMYFTNMGSYYRGTVLGYVPIELLVIGGQEFEIDNICPYYIDLFEDCVDFETLALGSIYGTGVNSPGEVIFTQGIIPVAVEEFYYDGGGSTFGSAEVMNGSGIGTDQAMRLGNINLLFDFTAYPNTPELVTFDYADYGGHENLAINGGAVYIGDLINANIPGFGIGVSQNGDIGTVAIDGGVETLLVGGQEFFVDNICAHFGVGLNDLVYAMPNASASLGQNYPNPFSGNTVIPFNVTEKTHVSIAVYDHLGRQLAILTDTDYEIGEYQLEWDGSSMPVGIYFYQLRTPDFMQSRKLSVGH